MTAQLRQQPVTDASIFWWQGSRRPQLYRRLLSADMSLKGTSNGLTEQLSRQSSDSMSAADNCHASGVSVHDVKSRTSPRRRPKVVSAGTESTATVLEALSSLSIQSMREESDDEGDVANSGNSCGSSSSIDCRLEKDQSGDGTDYRTSLTRQQSAEKELQRFGSTDLDDGFFDVDSADGDSDDGSLGEVAEASASTDGYSVVGSECAVDANAQAVTPHGSGPHSSRSRSSGSMITSRLKKGWKAVKKSGVKSTTSASKQLSSLSSSYWKYSSSTATNSSTSVKCEEGAAWEDRQSRICEEWVTSVLPSWKKKRSTARTRSLMFRGIPPRVRGRVWLVALGNPLNVPPDLYDILRERARDGRDEYLRSKDVIDKADGDVGGFGGHAEPMISEERSAHKAIMLDLPRTFPELAFFHADGSEYEDSLREILEAFIYLRPDIGYSQGMSFLAAVLLLYIENPSDVFTCFVNMLLHKSCFVHFFRMKMPEVRIYMSIHDKFMREEMPALHAHFKTHSVDPDLYMINWVMSLYCSALPLDFVSRIWDIYMLDGDVAIFRAALGILKLLMPQLLSMNFEDIAFLLSHIPTDDFEVDALVRAIRGVRCVTRHKFKEHFRACLAQHACQTCSGDIETHAASLKKKRSGSRPTSTSSFPDTKRGYANQSASENCIP